MISRIAGWVKSLFLKEALPIVGDKDVVMSIELACSIGGNKASRVMVTSTLIHFYPLFTVPVSSVFSIVSSIDGSSCQFNCILNNSFKQINIVIGGGGCSKFVLDFFNDLRDYCLLGWLMRRRRILWDQ